MRLDRYSPTGEPRSWAGYDEPIVNEYETWDELVDRANDKRSSAANKRKLNPDWHGVAGTFRKDVIRLARNGWPEGRKEMEQALGRIKAQQDAVVRPEVGFAHYGGSVDRGRYIAGNARCRRTMSPSMSAGSARQGSGRVIRILVNVAALGNVSRAAMIYRGAAALALANALDRAGIPTEVWVAAMSQHSRMGRMGCRVRVKTASAPADWSKLAYQMAHPSTFRSIVFREREMYGKDVGMTIDGGNAQTTTDEGKGIATKFDVVLPGLRTSAPWNSSKYAAEWVLNTLKELGLTTRHAA